MGAEERWDDSANRIGFMADEASFAEVGGSATSRRGALRPGSCRPSPYSPRAPRSSELTQPGRCSRARNQRDRAGQKLIWGASPPG